MSETVSAKVPIRILWHQELVDDGIGGSNFYMRLTPKADTRGRSGKTRITGLTTVIERLKRKESVKVQRAAKYGVQQGINAMEYAKKKRAEQTANIMHINKLAETTGSMSGLTFVYASSALERAVAADLAAGGAKDVQFEKEETEEKPEKEETYYIK